MSMDLGIRSDALVIGNPQYTMEVQTNDSNNVTYITMQNAKETPFHDVQKLLQQYNDIQAMRYFPVFVFMIIVMVVGTIGNSLVLVVYYNMFRKTSSNYFIVAMAIFDLLACLIGMPIEIYDLRHSLTFYNAAACKVFRCTESVVVYGSAIILVEIAIDRYFKICKPLMLIEIYKIKVMCIAAGVIAVILSIPSLILFGISRTPTPDPRVRGYDCSIAEQFRKATFSKVYYYTLGIVFVGTVLTLSALYIRIWVEIRRRKNLVIGDQVAASSSPKEDLAAEPLAGRRPTPKRVKVRYSTMLSDEGSSEGSKGLSFSSRQRIQTITDAMSSIRISRTTIILFAVTVAFAVSYLPAIVIMICRSVIKNLESEQSLAEQIFSKLFSKFYFVNNAINPLIYSFLNVSFRKRCVMIIKQMLFCRKKRFVRAFLPAEKTDSQKSAKSTKSTKNEVVL